jgi:transposase-like protein
MNLWQNVPESSGEICQRSGVTPKSETLGNVTTCIEWEDRVPKWKRKSPEFKKQAVKRMQEAKDLGLLAQELGVHVRTLYRWKDVQLGRLKPVREPQPREKKLEEAIQRLKQALANRTLEVDFFKGALQRVKARRQGNTATGGEASTTKSEA